VRLHAVRDLPGVRGAGGPVADDTNPDGIFSLRGSKFSRGWNGGKAPRGVGAGKFSRGWVVCMRRSFQAINARLGRLVRGVGIPGAEPAFYIMVDPGPYVAGNEVLCLVESGFAAGFFEFRFQVVHHRLAAQVQIVFGLSHSLAQVTDYVYGKLSAFYYANTAHLLDRNRTVKKAKKSILMLTINYLKSWHFVGSPYSGQVDKFNMYAEKLFYDRLQEPA
jgi:hypothetical protein